MDSAQLEEPTNKIATTHFKMIGRLIPPIGDDLEMSETKNQTQQCNILVCVTGSVATIKIIEILKGLQGLGYIVKLVSTEHALHFFKIEDVKELGIDVYVDRDEWESWKDRGDPVVHIEVPCHDLNLLVEKMGRHSLDLTNGCKYFGKNIKRNL
jgi:hypothetical protein